MKSITTDDHAKGNLLHAPFIPTDIRSGDPFSVLIKVDGKEINNIRPWKVSPLGIEVLTTNTDLSVSDKLTMTIKLGTQISDLYGVIVDIDKKNDQNLIYIKILNGKNTESLNGNEKRKSNRWICSEQFYPTAIATNPAKMSEFIYFRIKDISSDGFKLSTSLRNKFIFKGMVFEVLINFPMVTQLSTKIKITNVRIESENDKDYLILGAEYDKTSNKISEAISQYLLQFSNVRSLSELRENGLNTSKVSEAITFSFVKTEEEYHEMLSLRREAYLHANKISNMTKEIEMADQYDSKSRIIIGKYKERIICSARLVFCELDDQMELEKYTDWPSDFPRRDCVVEVTRACTAIDFRRSDLLMSMLRFIALTVVQSKRQHIIIWATSELIPLYNKIGFQPLNRTFLHTKLNNIEHHLMSANVLDAMMGKYIDPITWYKIWSPVTDFLDQYEMLDNSGQNRLRLLIYKILSPLSDFIIKIFDRKIESKDKYKTNKLNSLNKEAA